MNQEKANNIFEGDMGQQLDVIYSTSDGRVFIRYEEAEKHANGELSPDSEPLEDKTISDWYPEEIERIENMGFEVIQHEQTPMTPSIDDVSKFIEENSDVISAFGDYAESRKDGIGLAANQCSLNGERLNLRMIAVKDIKTHECVVAIDPKITRYHGVKRQKAEGCLTWGKKDGNYFIIIADRYHFVDIEYFTPEGNLVKETHKGFQAQVWQHEVNHINGVEEKVIGEAFVLEEAPDKNTGRNDKCPCGSGLKYKKCCINE
jgi:peptide deformylase